MAKIPGLPSFFSFFFFYSYRLLLRNTRASSKKYSYGYLNFYIFLSYFPGIHAIDRRNSKQVYLFLLKVLNRKKRFFSECLRTTGEIKAYFWNYYWLYHMLLFSEFFVNIQKIPFLWFWAFKTRFLLFSIEHTWIFHWHWMDFEHQIGFIIKYGVN